MKIEETTILHVGNIELALCSNFGRLTKFIIENKLDLVTEEPTALVFLTVV